MTFVVVGRQLFERKNFLVDAWCPRLDGLVGEVLQEIPVLVLVEVFLPKLEGPQINIRKTSAGMEGCPPLQQLEGAQSVS